MNWIKKRYDQFLLALLAVALLACAVLIFLKTQSFGEKFVPALTDIPQKKTVPAVPLEKIASAEEKLAKPPAWTLKDRGSLFISTRYLISKQLSIPVPPEGEDLHTDSLTGMPIPTPWFTDNALNLLDPTIPQQDPDKDGFTNEDEWRGHTDPNNKDSHPPYHTKLFLKQFIQIPFRLVVKSYDGDPKKDKPEKFSFQIDTIDLKQPSEFLKIGDQIPNTKFKIEKFEYKTVPNPNTGENDDASELTLVNTETGDKVVLVLNKVINSPDVFALFEYEWPISPTPQLIRVKKLQDFVLRPETDEKHHYKLIDINETEAQIQLPNGEKYTVKRDPRHAGK